MSINLYAILDRDQSTRTKIDMINSLEIKYLFTFETKKGDTNFSVIDIKR